MNKLFSLIALYFCGFLVSFILGDGGVEGRFKEFLGFFPSYEIGMDTTSRILPFPLAEEFVYNQVGDVLMELEYEDDEVPMEEYPEYEIMKPIGKITAKEFTAVLVFVNLESTFEYGEGSLLITYNNEGRIIDYRYFNIWTTIPKAGGELSMDFSARWTSKWSFDFEEVSSSVFGFDLEDEELKDPEVIENEFTGKMVMETDTLFQQCEILSSGEISCNDIRNSELHSKVVYY